MNYLVDLLDQEMCLTNLDGHKIVLKILVGHEMGWAIRYDLEMDWSNRHEREMSWKWKIKNQRCFQQNECKEQFGRTRKRWTEPKKDLVEKRPFRPCLFINLTCI